MFLGEAFLRVMRLSERSLEVAGGVILLMVAIRMIFSHEGGVYGTPEGKEPLIFPLAVPLLAGPSAMATVLLLASRQPERVMTWVAALTCAMLVSRRGAAAVRPHPPLGRRLGRRGDREADGPGAHRHRGGDDPGRTEALLPRLSRRAKEKGPVFRPALSDAVNFRDQKLWRTPTAKTGLRRSSGVDVGRSFDLGVEGVHLGALAQVVVVAQGELGGLRCRRSRRCSRACRHRRAFSVELGGAHGVHARQAVRWCLLASARLVLVALHVAASTSERRRVRTGRGRRTGCRRPCTFS